MEKSQPITWWLNMNVSISQSAASKTAKKKQFAPLGLEYSMELGDTSITEPPGHITTRPEFQLALTLQENAQPYQRPQSIANPSTYA
jgi:hypothetical protein